MRQITRGVMAVASSSCFIIAVVFMPLADVVAVAFISPHIATTLAALFLDEKVGIRRWSAIAVGLIGTLIVVRPGLGVFHPAIFLVLVSAAALAVGHESQKMVRPARHQIADRTFERVCLRRVGRPFLGEPPSTKQEH